MTKIWANSADSHVLEPADLWLQSLPPRLAQRAPRAERGDKYEILYIDGERVDRRAERLHGRDPPAGCAGPRHPAEGPRSGGRLGPARVPVHGLLDGQDQGPGAGPGNRADLERLGARGDPEQEQAGHSHRMRVPRTSATRSPISSAPPGSASRPCSCPARLAPARSTRSRRGSRSGPPRSGPASCSASTSAPAGTRWCSGGPAASQADCAGRTRRRPSPSRSVRRPAGRSGGQRADGSGQGLVRSSFI